MLIRRLLCLVPFLVAPAFAQDDDLPPDEAADIVERYVERADESFREGNYEEARLRFKKALKRDPKHKQARLGMAACYQAVGAYDKAEKEIAKHLEVHAGDRSGRVMEGRLALLRGRGSDARKIAREVIAKSPGEGPDLVGFDARILLAEALAARGERDKARTALDFFVDYYRKRIDDLSAADFEAERLRHKPDVARPIATEMIHLARALRLYVELSPLDHDFANNAKLLLESAQTLDPTNWDAWIEWVRVTRVEREAALARARKARDKVTPINPELADLYTEVAKSIVLGFASGEARGLAETALKVNPQQTDARAVVARVMLEDNEYSGAAEHIEAGLKTNPYHRDLLALKATLELLIGNDTEFEAGMKRLHEVDPTYGEGFHLAGLVVAARQRRYDTALELIRRGLKLDPMNFQAHATLGIFLANLGRAEEARVALEKSKKLFPFSHPIRENFRVVLEYVTETMTRHQTPHFVIRFDPGEYSILSLFLPELLEECWTDMVKRYDFTPKAPVLVEVFRKADDFSVRTIGLPGIPALGACFGGLITLDSPQALEPGAFQWAATARHEFAHVMSLQISKGQVPRWFTEGLSVLEEKPLDTGWGLDEDFERQVYDAYHTGTLPKVGTFDAMFRSSRVAYAYYVGGLMLEFLQKRSGEEGIVKALQLYGEDKPMREVFRRAFSLKLEEFDARFADYIGERIKNYRRVPNFRPILKELAERVLANPADGDSLLKLAWAYYQRDQFVDAAARFDQAKQHLKGDEPLAKLLTAHFARRANQAERAQQLYESFFAAGGEDFDARMLLASIYARDDTKQAQFIEQLEKAKAAWPLKVTGPNPYSELRRFYMSRGREDEATKMLEQQARIASRSIPLRLQLAREYGIRDRKADAVRVLEEVLNITLFNRPAHQALYPLYRDAKATKKAVRAARCVVALRNDKDADDEVARWQCDLAEALIADGQVEEAKAALAEAKKLAADEPRIKEIQDKLGQ